MSYQYGPNTGDPTDDLLTTRAILPPFLPTSRSIRPSWMEEEAAMRVTDGGENVVSIVEPKKREGGENDRRRKDVNTIPLSLFKYRLTDARSSFRLANQGRKGHCTLPCPLSQGACSRMAVPVAFAKGA